MPQTPAPRKAFAWARVSTGQQEERGLSMPEQLREIRRFAADREIEFKMTLSQVEVKKKFDLGEMLYKGQPAL